MRVIQQVIRLFVWHCPSDGEHVWKYGLCVRGLVHTCLNTRACARAFGLREVIMSLGSFVVAAAVSAVGAVSAADLFMSVY